MEGGTEDGRCIYSRACSKHQSRSGLATWAPPRGLQAAVGSPLAPCEGPHVDISFQIRATTVSPQLIVLGSVVTEFSQNRARGPQ